MIKKPVYYVSYQNVSVSELKLLPCSEYIETSRKFSILNGQLVLILGNTWDKFTSR